MTQQASAVTPDRYASGFTYQEYLAQIKVNRDWFERLYQAFHLDSEDAEYFRRAAQDPRGPAKMMVIGEDWCPDVYRGMPVLARIAEAGGMDMRVFPRDSNMDIMDEFLKEGKWASIPTAVLYTKDHEYICHWVERPALADQEMEDSLDAARREHPDAQEPQLRAAARPRNQERYPAWQQEMAREIRKLLVAQLGR